MNRPADAARILQAEAAATALRLGHTLTDWLPMAKAEWLARCLTCSDAATVHIGAGAPQAGPALWFACRKAKPRVEARPPEEPFRMANGRWGIAGGGSTPTP